MSTSHSPSIDKIHSIPNFAFAQDEPSWGKLQSFESGPKQRSKWVVANSRLNFSFGDFDLHHDSREMAVTDFHLLT